MANATEGFQHDNRAPIGATRESLWDVITSIRTDETYLTSTAPKVSVGDQVHMWPTKSPRSITGRADPQGTDPTFDNTDTSRSQNFTQIIKVAYELTGSRMAVNAVGGDPWSVERNEAMKDWKDELEFSAIRSSLVSGNNSTASRMQGLRAFASTLLTSQSGVSFNETMFNDYIGNAWSIGIDIDTFLVGKTLKRRISGFTAGNVKNVDADEATLYGRIDVYDSDYGRVKMVKHRFVTNSADVNQDLLGYDSEYVKIGFLREPHFEKLAKTGDAEREMVVGEATLQVDSEKAVLWAKAHL